MLVEDLQGSNGLAFSPDEQLLYLVESRAAPQRKSWQYDVVAGSAGLSLKNREGRPLTHIHLSERCANLCFGGARHNRLFMAASHSLYALHVNAWDAVV